MSEAKEYAAFAIDLYQNLDGVMVDAGLPTKDNVKNIQILLRIFEGALPPYHYWSQEMKKADAEQVVFMPDEISKDDLSEIAETIRSKLKEIFNARFKNEGGGFSNVDFREWGDLVRNLWNDKNASPYGTASSRYTVSWRGDMTEKQVLLIQHFLQDKGYLEE